MMSVSPDRGPKPQGGHEKDLARVFPVGGVKLKIQQGNQEDTKTSCRSANKDANGQAAKPEACVVAT